MAKKKQAKKGAEELQKMPMPRAPGTPEIPKEAQEKLKEIKKKLEKFKDKALEKFEDYIMGLTLLPPPKPKEGEKVNKDIISVLILVDDSDSKKMSKYELREKLQSIMETTAKEVDKNITPDVVILSELWQNCYDGKNDLLQLISMGAPIHDTGMLQAIKISEIHKTMVLKKFEKYIVSYVLAGSLTQGRATKSSDIDVWVVIDDTDVKKMTRVELKDKLRAIIIGMGVEAGEITGIKNKLNIQVYILTDFWDSLKEANPIIFTLLRDGVPFYDRGMFMPWKQMLRMGKIKPSTEAIDMFMSSGDQMLNRVKFALKNIGMEDIYYAILTPSQAALMLYGIAPPAPRETAELMRDIFVKKEKLIEAKYVDILEKNINIRKDLEHNAKKEISGKEVDQLLSDAEKYLARIKKLFTQIEKMKEEEDMIKIYDNVITIIRDVLKSEGIERVGDVEIVSTFENELIAKGLIPAKYLRSLNEIIKAKKDYEEKKLTKQEVESVKKESRGLIKVLVEHIQRKRGRELDRAKIRFKYGEKFGEVLLLDNVAFVTQDIDKPEKEISKASVRKDGRLDALQDSNLEELEKELSRTKVPARVFIHEGIFEDLKRLFGKDVQILVNY